VAKVHPEYHTPGIAVALLSIWSALLVLSGRYEQLYTMVIFSSWILYAMATASVLVLRRTQPGLNRPYRTLGYPVVPIVFVLVAITLLVQTMRTYPRESILGLVFIMAGLPFYFHWKRRVLVK
jgi:APA family basic amino acid/polyamine antiporter